MQVKPLKIEGGLPMRMRFYPGNAREWDWNETGTRHSPSIQPADVQELLDHGAQTIIFGTGFYERLKVQPEMLRMLEERGVSAYVRQSEEAVRLLGGSDAVGGLIHSTC